MKILIFFIIVIFLLLIIFNYNNTYEKFIDGDNVNIHSLSLTNSNIEPNKNSKNYTIKRKAAVNANSEKFIIKYPIKYNNFINTKKNKIAQCISAVEESYNYPDSDIDSYIKKTEIPNCPNYPDMKEYIKKTEIPDCPRCPDMNDYIKKTHIHNYLSNQ